MSGTIQVQSPTCSSSSAFPLHWSGKTYREIKISFKALYMLEFLELNNLLGVSHFTFYNHTIGPKATCIMQHYMDGKIPQQFAVNSTARPTSGEKNATVDSATPSRYPKITVELLPWNLKMKSQKEIRTEGLFASLNDCLYRSMYRWVTIDRAGIIYQANGHRAPVSFQIFSRCFNWFRWIYYSTS